jgi:hypothetical protein
MSKESRKQFVSSFQQAVDPEEVCHRLVPPQYWEDVLESLARSIDLAHQQGPDRWGIRVAISDIMLKVGSHEVLQIGEWDLPFHLIVDKNTVPHQLRGRSELWFSGDVVSGGNSEAKGIYRSNPGSEACDMPFELVRSVYQELFNSHAEIISRAARKPKHPSTRATHSARLIRFMGEELGKVLPQPSYWNASEDKHLLWTAEELPNDDQFIEGATQQKLLTVYERNPRARRLCIEYYGARCCICGLSFEDRYGAEAAGIIHVHHIIPLSEIGESYQVDPIKDLRPVCPNCHAVIHSTNPPRTIEQVTSMLRGG